eukprot:SAG22_NODE_7_length_40155_cov_25.241356_32_plen_128_part_00
MRFDNTRPDKPSGYPDWWPAPGDEEDAGWLRLPDGVDGSSFPVSVQWHHDVLELAPPEPVILGGAGMWRGWNLGTAAVTGNVVAEPPYWLKYAISARAHPCGAEPVNRPLAAIAVRAADGRWRLRDT